MENDKKQRDSFIFFRSYYEAVKDLNMKTQNMVYSAIFEYALNHNEIELSGTAKSMFSLIKPLLDKNYQNWLNGCKGGASSKSMKGNQNARKNKPKSDPKQTEIKGNELCIMSDDLCLMNNDLSDMGNESLLPSSLKGNQVISLPLNKNGTFKHIYEKDIEYYSELYPNVDVLQEFRNMIGWLNADPKRKKTAKGIDKFINHWLCTNQDKGSKHIPSSEEIELKKRTQEAYIRDVELRERREQQKGESILYDTTRPE